MKRVSTFGTIGDVLSDETSLRLLSILAKAPQFVKSIAHLMEKRESRISEKVSSLRKLGMIDYRWTRVNGRNVKEYFLTAKKIEINLSSRRPTFLIKRKDSISEIRSPEFIDFSAPRIKSFVGREAELRMLKEKPKVFITGISGIGKTSLAAKYATGLKEPVFWHAMREVDSLDYLLLKMSSFLDSIGRKNLSRMTSLGVSKRMIIDYCISELRRVRSIIVIDDFQLCRDKNVATFIEDLSLSEPSLKIVLISRENTPPARGYQVINLAGLTIDESRLLLSNAGKKHDLSTISSLGGYPLALSLICKISEEKATIETLSSILAAKIRKELGTSEREVLCWASAIRDAFTLEELNYVLERNVAREVGLLLSRGLISPRSRTFYVHEFVRNVAASLQSDPKSIHEKLGHHYASDPDPTSTIEAIYHFGEAGNSGHLVGLIKEKASRLVYSGFSEPFLSVLNLLKKKVHDPVVRGWILLWVAMIEKMSGNYSISRDIFEEIIKSSKNVDEELAIKATLGLGQTLDFLGRKEESVETLQKALTAERRKIKMEDIEANILLSLGIALTDLGKLDQAQPVLSRAVEIYRKIGDRRDYFAAIFYRGYESYLKGDFGSEIKDMDEAYSGLFEMNFLLDAASCLLPKALTLWRQGNSNKALLALNKAIEIYKDQSEKLAEGDLTLSLCCRAMIYAFIGKVTRAEKDLREAESFGRGEEDYSTNTARGIAWGIISAHRGDWVVSERYLASAEQAAKDHPYYLCEAKKWRGWTLVRKGSIDEAIKKFEEVRDLAAKSGLKIFINDIEKLLAESKTPLDRKIKL